MFKRRDDMKLDLRENMRGGQGTTRIQHIIDKEELRGKARLIGRITLEPGSSIGTHPHDGEEEIYYILSGSALVEDDGQTREIGPGDAVLTGNGSTHSIANNGTEPLEFVAVILTY